MDEKKLKAEFATDQELNRRLEEFRSAMSSTKSREGLRARDARRELRARGLYA